MDYLFLESLILYFFRFFITILFWAVVIFVGVPFLFWIIRSPSQVYEDEIIQRWGILLNEQSGKKEKFFKNLLSEMDKRSLPYGGNRLKIGFTNPQDYYVFFLNNEFSCYVSAIPQGKDLYVLWSLRQRSWREFLANLPLFGWFFAAIFRSTTFNAYNTARAFASITLDCTREAAEEIMEKAGLDKSRLKRESSGKLGPL